MEVHSTTLLNYLANAIFIPLLCVPDDGSTPADLITTLFTTSSVLRETTALSWTTGEDKGTKTAVLHYGMEC